MNEMSIVIVAASIAAGMAFLVRADVSPSLRAAIRTTAVLVIVWSLAANKANVSWNALPWRIWLMLALSVFAIAAAWRFHFRDSTAESGPAMADRLNVPIAVAFAVLLLSDPSLRSQSWGMLLIVSGAIILALKQR
jgi:uncharacterized membrane protein